MGSAATSRAVGRRKFFINVGMELGTSLAARLRVWGHLTGARSVGGLDMWWQRHSGCEIQERISQ
eukprot:8700250-Lingulodinium_polyedra.AAC.1